VEHLAALVSSRGILKSCGAQNRHPVSSHTALDVNLLSNHRPGGSIYVCTDAVPEFSRNVLPRISTPFTLVTGDSDRPVNPQSLGEASFRAILENQHCLAWFAQNIAAAHDKLHPLPIGLDYHTMAEKPGLWGISPISPLVQEHELLATWGRSRDRAQRYLGMYCNWTDTLERGDRRTCLEQVDRALLYVERGRIPRASTWARQAEFLFVLSPEGAGMDCHRTWESILLGCVPIMRRNSVSALLAELPALIVDDWSQVRREPLEKFMAELPGKRFDFSAMFRETWMRRIHRLPPAPRLELTYDEFRLLLTRSTA
jgi:hypothetical protein